MNILGLSAYYHDSAAALVRDGEIVAAAEEERFTRVKGDASFPARAIRYCLAAGGVGPSGLDAVAFYDKPLAKFARILTTYLSVAPRGLNSFVAAMPAWMKQKLMLPLEIERGLDKCGTRTPQDVYFFEHHESHAASAFYPSPFEDAAILTVDGVGEWTTASIGAGSGNRIELLEEMRFPHSLGLLYTAFTSFCGFKVNEDEYKLMGLAPYGEPRYADLIRGRIVDLKEDGSFALNMRYFGYLDGLRMTNEAFSRLFGGPPRVPDAEITRREADIARSIQDITEEIVLRMARHARAVTGQERLCLAGGVALNCVANGRLLREGVFTDVWIQPAAGDAGGAVGAALKVWHGVAGNSRRADGRNDRMNGALLGPEFTDGEIESFLRERGLRARKLSREERAPEIARRLAAGRIVGILQGRMEFGPRALGNRSILADPRDPGMQARLNGRIKFRESFRPFAPACLAERAAACFETDRPSPYMLFTAPIRKERRIATSGAGGPLSRANEARSDLPAVTHVDFSSRLQTVDEATNPPFHAILKAFEDLTGCPVLVNTSFNVRGEPIVCTPEDAYGCFARTGLDDLVLGSYLISRER